MYVLPCVQQLRVKAKTDAGPMSVARLPINQGRNRYRDVLPGMGRRRQGGGERRGEWGTLGDKRGDTKRVYYVCGGGKAVEQWCCCVWVSRLASACVCLVCAKSFGGVKRVFLAPPKCTDHCLPYSVSVAFHSQLPPPLPLHTTHSIHAYIICALNMHLYWVIPYLVSTIQLQ